MKQAETIAITALGAMTPVGSHVKQSCASIRAGINRFMNHPYFYPQLPEPALSEAELAMVSPIVPLNPSAPLVERLIELSMAPMRELIIAGKLRREDFKSTAILISLPDGNRTRPFAGYEKAFLGEYFRRLAIEPSSIQQVFQEGHTGVFSAMTEASRLLRSGACRLCIILGIDSYLDKESLHDLDQAYRLKSERNVDGFIPGESAVLVLLETIGHAQERNMSVLAKIGGLGHGVEKENILSDKISSGKGLGDALAQVPGLGQGQAVGWVICDMNGESARSREWGIVQCRSSKVFGGLRKLSHPADCVGDIGAASGALFVAIACQGFARGYTPESGTLLWTSSDFGQRAVCYLERPS